MVINKVKDEVSNITSQISSLYNFHQLTLIPIFTHNL